MASSATLVRLTGKVLKSDSRSGLIKNGPRAGEPYEINSVNVLVANQDVTVAQLPRRDERGQFPTLEAGFPRTGAVVDLLVEVTVYSGDIQTRIIGDFPLEATAEALEELATA